MADNAEKQMQKAVLAMAAATRDLTDGAATQITVGLQNENEAPYAIEVRDQQYPETGIVQTPS